MCINLAKQYKNTYFRTSLVSISNLLILAGMLPQGTLILPVESEFSCQCVHSNYQTLLPSWEISSTACDVKCHFVFSPKLGMKNFHMAWW
uniref:Uncharacterized protein n=1 Tax=Oryza brachyantha TaxID=4533 RepID=J3LHF9_ORYBR